MPPTGKVYWHYTSSSPDPAQSNNPNVLWAEEGASRGSYPSSSDDELNGPNYAYRCIRNLGISLDSPDEKPEDLVQVTDNEDGTYTLDLSYMNPKSLRTAYDNGRPLPGGNEKSANNRPYRSFVVDAAAYGFESPYNNILKANNGGPTTEGQSSSLPNPPYDWVNDSYWVSYQNINPCPEGFRIPNQRELLIMSTRLGNDKWPKYSITVKYHTGYWDGVWPFRRWIDEGEKSITYNDLIPPYYICQTSFSMNDFPDFYTDLREGFLWHYESKNFILQNTRAEVGYVRCIRDTN